MASVLVSTSVAYNPPNFTTYCGQIYCSDAFEEFMINCTTCTQEFNLLSCNLFIKHVKECLSFGMLNPASETNANSNHAIENIFTSAMKEDNMEYVHTGDNHLDPLMSMKVEIEPLDSIEEQHLKDVVLSDYKDEDDLTIDKIARRAVIEGIIDEYKNHPQLWSSKNTIEADKLLHYSQIADTINSKFKTSLTSIDLRYQIYNIKAEYKRALKTMQQMEKNPQLWYFNKIAFIDETRDEIVQKALPNEEDINDAKSSEESDNKNSLAQEHPMREKLEPYQLQNQTLVSDVIDQYKKYPYLWDQNAIRYNNKNKRKEAFCRIAHFIQKKYKKKVTHRDIVKKIEYLRSGYRGAFQRSIASNQPVTLWYYDKLSFVFEKRSGNHNQDLEKPGPADECKDEKSFKETHDNETVNHPPDSSYKDEDTIHCNEEGLSDRKIVLSLIDEYKKNPCLWKNDIYYASSSSARCRGIKEITATLNKKFNKNFTDLEVRQKIIQLRGSYRRVLRKKETFEKDPTNANRKFIINLYYFNKMSFIGKTYNDTVLLPNGPKRKSFRRHRLKTKNQMLTDSDENSSIEMEAQEQSGDEKESKPYQEPIEHQTDEMPLSEFKNETNFRQSPKETQDYESLDHKQMNCSDDGDEYFINDRNIVLRLIEEYKKHPCLWDSTSCSSSSHERLSAIKAITNSINLEFKKIFTESQVKNKLYQMKRCYRQELHRKAVFQKNPSNANKKFDINLYYFDNISFVGATERDSKKNIKDDGLMSLESNENLASENKSDDDFKEPYKELTKNVQLLTAIIEEYKKHPMLWSLKRYSTDNLFRRNAYQEMAVVINNKFNTEFTCTNLIQEVRRLRFSYTQMLHRSQENPNFKTKMWYADLLSFIENEGVNNGISQIPPDDVDDDSDDDYYNLASDSTHTDEWCIKSRGKHQSKRQVFAVIDLYKAAPILWDTNHPQYTMRNERKKAIENILAALSKEHDYLVTADELRYNIRLLRESYFRALPNKAIMEGEGDLSKSRTKRFFHDRISFLRPFAKKKRTTAPQLQIDNQPDPCENFTYLTDNRPLMVSFIKLYEEQGCLWDQKHKDNRNPAAESKAYDKLISMFLDCGVVLTKEQVISAISFLHSTVVSTQKSVEADEMNEATKEPMWFYDHLEFLGKIRRVVDKYCTHCNQEFRTLREYERHKIEIAGDFPYKCTICDRGFLSRSKYQYHQLTHRQPHKCELCEFQAADKTNFQVHMLRHKGITQYSCEHCDKGFVTSSELRRHVQVHTGEKPVICDICGAKYAAKSGFHQHMKRHRNQRDHKCEMCGHAFYSQKCLRDHMTTHSDERKHICDTCGAAFKRKKTLSQHKSLHAEYKKHACKICGKLFAQKAGVYSHMKSHGLIIENS